MAATARPPTSAAPRQVTSFVGRERQLAEMGELILRPDVRLVTLTGPGGIGKSRLSLEVMATLGDRFPGGTAFVPLGRITDPGLVPATIAQSLGLREDRPKALPALLADRLAGPRVLLVLDNFEHLLDAAGLVSELLTGTNVTV